MAANGNGAPPVGQENINTDIVTLTRFLTEEQTKHPDATGDFTYAQTTPSHSAPTNMGPASSATLSNSPSSPLPTTSDAPR